MFLPLQLQVFEGGRLSDGFDLGLELLAPWGVEECLAVLHKFLEFFVECEDLAIVKINGHAIGFFGFVEGLQGHHHDLVLSVRSLEHHLGLRVKILKLWTERIVHLEPLGKVLSFWRHHQLLDIFHGFLSNFRIKLELLKCLLKSLPSLDIVLNLILLNRNREQVHLVIHAIDVFQLILLLS